MSQTPTEGAPSGGSSVPASVTSQQSNIRLFPRLNHPASRAWQEPSLRASQLVYPIFVTCEEEDKDIAGFYPNKQWGHGLSGDKVTKDTAAEEDNSLGMCIASPINYENIDFVTRGPSQAYHNGMYSSLVAHLTTLMEKGLRSVMIFGVVPASKKDSTGTAGDDAFRNPVCIVLRILRTRLPDLQLMVDVCLCEYTDHGHCGCLQQNECSTILPSASNPSAPHNEMSSNSAVAPTSTATGRGIFDLPKSLKRLASCAEQYAKAGAHWVCPSDMMDGRVAAIRASLDAIGHSSVGILAYSSKKASSSLYAPFRVAVDSTFKGNRKQYQQPVGSRSIATAAWNRDTAEGCDAVLVKPSLFYTDIIRQYADLRDIPSSSPSNSAPLVAAYVVSGEYKMLFDYGTATQTMEEVVAEAHLSLVRAGADILITYFAPFILEKLC